MHQRSSTPIWFLDVIFFLKNFAHKNFTSSNISTAIFLLLTSLQSNAREIAKMNRTPRYDFHLNDGCNISVLVFFLCFECCRFLHFNSFIWWKIFSPNWLNSSNGISCQKRRQHFYLRHHYFCSAYKCSRERNELILMIRNNLQHKKFSSAQKSLFQQFFTTELHRGYLCHKGKERATVNEINGELLKCWLCQFCVGKKNCSCRNCK